MYDIVIGDRSKVRWVVFKNILIMLMFNSEVGCEGFDRMYVVFIIYCNEMTDIKLVKLV